jgi:hypothetical protein
VAITEAGTSKKTLVGIFDKIMAQAIPTLHGPFWLYAKLTDFDGNHEIRIDVVHLATEKQIASLVVQVQRSKSVDPRDNFELVLPIPPFPFPLEGAYEFQMFADNIFIGRAVVNLIKVASPDASLKG